MDGELSELEAALLDAHLARCPACDAFDAGIRATAELVRSAPLERPERPVELPAGRRLVTRRRATVAAVAAAAALGSLIGAMGERPGGSPERTAPPQISLLEQDVDQLRQLPRGVETPPRPGEPGNPREGVI